ncbi:MAG: hypothetical protein C0595_05525 [Marinilabiliales bacterium]|nr:MAG: hypothetical protein C0595_05525 [Marinilabiliales bacterium]
MGVENTDLLEQNDSEIFKIEGDLSILNIDEFRENLIKLIDSKNNLVLDCSKLESIDLSIVQLIISLILERNNIGFSTKVDYSDNELITIFFNKTGLSQVFNKITKSNKNE